MFDVVGLGTVAADIVKRVDKLPAADGFAVILETTFLPGGSGSNVITQISRLGGTCAYIAQVGDDSIGEVVIGSLKDEKVDTSGILIKEKGSTIHTEIVVDQQGEKFILLSLGDSFLSMETSGVNYGLLDQAKVYFTDLLPGGPAIEGLKRAKEKGLNTVVNMQVNLGTMTGLGVNKETILAALPYIDVFAPCREGLFDLCETQDVVEAKDCIRKSFSNTLLVTLGGKGSVAFDKEDRMITVAPHPVKVVDTTGAGDSYLGGFIYKHFIQQSGLQESMEFASRCAAFTCGGLGARSCPTLEDVLSGRSIG
jgi:sugar/nucleoside kinase (ribokinase family)